MTYIYLSIILSIVSLLELLSNNRYISKILIIAITIFLVIFTGTRTWGGTDLDNYRIFFENIDSSEISYGILYETLNRSAIFLDLNFDQFLLLLAIVVVPSQAYFFYRSCKYPSTAFFLFYSFNFIWLDHILIRQSIASIFLLMGASLYIASKRFWSVLSVTVATLFHASALFWSIMSLVMLSQTYIRATLIALLIVIGFAFVYVSPEWIATLPGMSPNIPRYLVESEGVAFSNLIETLVVVGLFVKKKSYYHPNERLFFSAVLFCSIVVIGLSYIIAPAARFLDYSKIFFVIIAVRYLEKTPPETRVLFALPVYFYGIAKIFHFCMTFDGGVLFYE